MLASAIALGVLAGAVTGGRIDALGRLSIRGLPVLIAAVLLRLLAPGVPELAGVLSTAALTVIVVIAVLNGRVPGLAFVALGAGLNLAVIVANGGMPVAPEATRLGVAGIPNDGFHVRLDGSTRFGFLGDVIPIPPVGVFSAGDLVLAFGAFMAVFTGMRRT